MDACKRKIRILFIGNSLTYVNDLPEVVRRLFEGVGIEADCFMLAVGGKCMDYHARQAETAYNIRYGHYDYIVLQGKATGFDPDPFYENGKIIFDKFISGTGAKPVMYVAWSLRGEAEKQPSMTAAYTKLAGYTGGLVAPAGEAWQKALRLRPAPEIYKEDGNHPTRAGTYLCSLCIFYAITGRKKSMALGERGYFSDYGLDRHAAVAFNRIACEKTREFNS